MFYMWYRKFSDVADMQRIEFFKSIGNTWNEDIDVALDELYAELHNLTARSELGFIRDVIDNWLFNVGAGAKTGAKAFAEWLKEEKIGFAGE